MINSEATVRENAQIRWQRVDYGADSFLVASYAAADNWRLPHQPTLPLRSPANGLAPKNDGAPGTH